MGNLGYSGYTAGAIYLMIALISFLGFLLENVWLAFRKGYMDNRNMYAPFLMGYGITIMGFYTVLGTPRNMWIFGNPVNLTERGQMCLYFVLTFLLVSAGEIVLGIAVEKTCHIIWWDYSSLPLHLTRYTSVFTSLGFTVLITVFMDCSFEPIMNLLMGLDPVKSCVVGRGLVLLMAADMVVNMSRMKRTGKLKTIWKLDFAERSFYYYKDGALIKR